MNKLFDFLLALCLAAIAPSHNLKGQNPDCSGNNTVFYKVPARINTGKTSLENLLGKNH